MDVTETVTASKGVYTPAEFKSHLMKILSEMSDVFNLQEKMNRLGTGEAFAIDGQVLGLYNLPKGVFYLGRKEVQSLRTQLKKEVSKINAMYAAAYRYQKPRAGPLAIIKLNVIGNDIVQRGLGQAWKVEFQGRFFGPAEAFAAAQNNQDMVKLLESLKARLKAIKRIGLTAEGDKDFGEKITKVERLTKRQAKFVPDSDPQGRQFDLNQRLYTTTDQDDYRGYLTRAMMTQIWALVARNNQQNMSGPKFDVEENSDLSGLTEIERYRIYTQQVSTYSRRWKSDILFEQKRTLELQQLSVPGRETQFQAAQNKWNNIGTKKMAAAEKTASNLPRKTLMSSSRLKAGGIIPNEVFTGATIGNVEVTGANEKMRLSLIKKMNDGEFDEEIRKLEKTEVPKSFDVQIKKMTLEALENKKASVDRLLKNGSPLVTKDLFNRLDFQYMTGVVSEPVKKEDMSVEFREQVVKKVRIDTASLYIAKHAADTMGDLAEARADQNKKGSSMSPRGNF